MHSGLHVSACALMLWPAFGLGVMSVNQIRLFVVEFVVEKAELVVSAQAMSKLKHHCMCNALKCLDRNI